MVAFVFSCSTSTSSQKCAQAFSWAYYVEPLNKLNYARQKITEEFRACAYEMEKIKIAARQWHNNNTRGYRDFRSKNAISKSFSEIAVLCMS